MKFKVIIWMFFLTSGLIVTPNLSRAGENALQNSTTFVEQSMVVTSGLIAPIVLNQLVISPDDNSSWYSIDDLDENPSADPDLLAQSAILCILPYASINFYYRETPTKRHQLYFTGGVG